jgi:hypothetical protein
VRTLGALVSAVPDFAMACVFYVTWIAPTTFGETMVAHLVLVMLLEFLVVHSAAFMAFAVYGGGTRPQRIAMMLGLTAFYAIFALAFSAGFDTWWPAQAMAVLALNRSLPLLLGALPDERELDTLMAAWAVSVIFYLGGASLTIIRPVPPFGITPEVIAAQGFTVGGEWPEQPYRPIAFGVLYFTAQGLFELATGLWLARRPLTLPREDVP